MFVLGAALLGSLALHAVLLSIRVPAPGAALSAEIELVSVDTGLGTGDGGRLSAGPLAARQDLPPQRAPEPETPSSPLPPGTVPLTSAGPSPATTQATALEPEASEGGTPPEEVASTDGTGTQGAGAEDAGNRESADGASSAASGSGLPLARIPSGGAPGGTGLPGGGTTLGGTGSGSGGSAGQPPAARERRFIPYYRVDRPPKIIQNATLEYPAQARRRNLEATVVLEADIDETGSVEEVRVVKPAGFGFDEAAVKYLEESRFSPAYVGDTPVAVMMRIAVQFSLSD
jgi:TonB family protein